MAGVRGSKVFHYSDQMRSRAKELFNEIVPSKSIKRPFGIWTLLASQMRKDFPELLNLPEMTLRSWIRNVCLHDKVSISERSKLNSKGIEAIKQRNKERNEEFRRTYSDRLRERHGGTIEIVNESTLIDALTPILHRCAIHDYTSSNAPAWLLSGRRMKCCGYESNMVDQDELDRRADICGIRWIGSYINGDTERKCECVECGHIFSILPNSLQNKIQRGRIEEEASPCRVCRSLIMFQDGIRTLSRKINYARDNCYIYIYWDTEHEWFKIGISKNPDKRAKSASSGDNPSSFYDMEISRHQGTRAECWATEQVALALSKVSEPSDEDKAKWTNKNGVTELRRASDWQYDTEAITIWINELIENCKEIGWIPFMRHFHPDLDMFSRRELDLAEKCASN